MTEKHLLTSSRSYSAESIRIQKLKSEGSSCLTCNHTSSACGFKLLCKLKNSLVSQYNVCHHHNATLIGGK